MFLTLITLVHLCWTWIKSPSPAPSAKNLNIQIMIQKTIYLPEWHWRYAWSSVQSVKSRNLQLVGNVSIPVFMLKLKIHLSCLHFWNMIIELFSNLEFSLESQSHAWFWILQAFQYFPDHTINCAIFFPQLTEKNCHRSRFWLSCPPIIQQSVWTALE